MLAYAYAWGGAPEQSPDWLEIAVERGFINYPFLAHHDTVFAPLWKQRRFRGILDGVRRRREAFEA